MTECPGTSQVSENCWSRGCPYILRRFRIRGWDGKKLGLARDDLLSSPQPLSDHWPYYCSYYCCAQSCRLKHGGHILSLSLIYTHTRMLTNGPTCLSPLSPQYPGGGAHSLHIPQAAPGSRQLQSCLRHAWFSFPERIGVGEP